jgi:pyridoxamine 5'-phosphate oxidase
VTDGRSALREIAGTSKAEEIANNPWTEVCWYFAKTREQFRIAGKLQLIDAQSVDCQPERQSAWDQMSDAGKVQFYWPLPGATRTMEDFGEHELTLEPAADFCLLLLSPVMVDRLELRGNPQSRSRYCLLDNQEWSIDSINP